MQAMINHKIIMSLTHNHLGLSNVPLTHYPVSGCHQGPNTPVSCNQPVRIFLNRTLYPEGLFCVWF